MDTYSFKNAGDLIIHYIEEICSENINFNGHEEKEEVYLKILELNYNTHLFNKKIKLPNIEYSLLSKNIFEDYFKKKDGYFRPLDYQYKFLIYLFLNYEKFKNKELRHIVDAFVEEVKGQFSIEDIERTDTGAVRCKTNIRFAVLTLRQFGLMNYMNLETKRDWTPTILGFLICCLVIVEKPIDKNILNIYELENLDPYKNTLIDNRLRYLIKKLDSDTNFENLIEKLKLDHKQLDSLNNVKKMINDYSTFIEVNLQDLKNKIITKFEFQKRLNILIKKTDTIYNIEKFKTDLINISKSELTLEKIKEILYKNN